MSFSKGLLTNSGSSIALSSMICWFSTCVVIDAVACAFEEAEARASGVVIWVIAIKVKQDTSKRNVNRAGIKQVCVSSV